MIRLARFLTLIRPYRTRVLAAVCAFVVMSFSFLLIPILTKDILASALTTHTLPYSPMQWSAFAVVLLLLAAASYEAFVLMYDVADHVNADLRTACVHRLLSVSITYHQDRQTGELMDRLVSSFGDIERFIKYFILGAAGLAVAMTGAVIMLFVLNWKLAVVTLAPMPLFTLMYRVLFRKIRAALARSESAGGQITAHIHEILSGIDAIKSFSRERRELERFAARQSALVEEQRKATRIAALIDPVVVTALCTTLLLVLTCGAWLLARGELEPATLIAFLLYATMLVPQSRLIGQFLLLWENFHRAIARIDEIRTLPVEEDPPNAIPLPRPVRGEVELKNVTFGYPGRSPAIDDVSLKISSQECLAIVGASGAGKTTLFNLLLRLQTPQEGALLIDGIDIAGANAGSIRDAIALVSQDIVLFDDTLAENVRFGKPGAALEEVRHACRLAQIDDYITTLPEGYQSRAGERGVKLSGGQRQRIAIARALLKDAPILLLDEATSSLDAQTEQQLHEALFTVMRGRTTIVIAHRLSTVTGLPRIVVLHEGRLLDDGSHEELLERCERYRTMVAHQLIPIDEKPRPFAVG